MSLEGEKRYLYFQIRSASKKDYPNLLDITAAGHILAHETISEGIREVKEELGLDIPFEQFISLGIIDYSVKQNDFIDNELAHAFIYLCNSSFDQFEVQSEEVSGIVRAEFDLFCDLWSGRREDVKIEGFEIIGGKREHINKTVVKNAFVQHSEAYYSQILSSIREKLEAT
ncbi:NUDIX hydrolase [Paenibacillus aceti]|uniref:NUDIX hydrolase n=1 Tax=Paenibacillus aceti TaxID=1820010 RepID=UPI00308431E9